MNAEQARQYCLNRPDATEEFPFVPDVPVFKIKGKMFGLLGRCSDKGKELGQEYAGCHFLNLKCDPAEAQMLRDIFPEVRAAYHMSKTHWISVVLVSSMPEKEIERLIDRSYALVVKGLKKAQRLQLELKYPDSALYR